MSVNNQSSRQLPKPARCPSCGQFEPTSSAHRLNQRAQRLIESGRIQFPAVPDFLSAVLSNSHLFRFGFDDFIPSTADDAIVARWRVAIKVPDDTGLVRFGNYRYFACMVSEESRAYEHTKGSIHDITGAPTVQDFAGDYYDIYLQYLMQKSLFALRDFVVKNVFTTTTGEV